MKKYFSHILILVAVISFFAPNIADARGGLGQAQNFTECMEDWANSPAIGRPSQADAQRDCQIRFQSDIPLNPDGSVKNQTPESSGCGITNPWACFMDIVLFIPGWASQIVLVVANLILWISGALLNTVVKYTVVDMSDNLSKVDVVNSTWKVIRDISNIGFIFVLLYAAIETILGMGKDNQKLIVKIVTVAILINFSLFFTKFVIDASNVIALTFYDAIAPGALNSADTSLGGVASSVVSGGTTNQASGLSNSLMEPLRIQNIMQNVKGYDGTRLTIIGVMGTVISLIAAFVFFAVSLMFIIRFVVLIFVLVLSPIAFVAFILPGLEGRTKEWWDALSGQAFFAPIYFLLTWIVIKLIRGIFPPAGTWNEALVGIVGPNGTTTAGDVTIIMNFIIIIAMLITSLTVAKSWANKAGPAVSKLTSWATGAAGGMTVGMAGRLGRNTLGAGASRLTQSEGFQRWAGRSLLGQQLFKGTQRTAQSSFDLRATNVGNATVGALGGGEAQRGGQEATIQNKIAAREKFAQSLRAPARGGAPSAKEAYAARISGGPITHGGTRNSGNTIFGTLGRSNRIAASKILSGQLTPLETQEQNLQNRENQLSQQLSGMNNELTTINAAIANHTATPQQIAREAILNGPIGNRGSIAYIQDQLTTTQANLTRVTAETTRIRALIAANQLNNPANQITNPVTGVARPARADEQNY